MAVQTLPGGLWVPPPIGFSGSVPVHQAHLIDATAEKVAFIIQAPKTGTLDQFEFSLGTVTQAPASGLTCSFQDVDLTSGDPDGVQDQTRVVTAGLTTGAWVAPGLITSDGTDTGTKRSVTRGDLLACVIEFTSWAASDSLNINGFATAGDTSANAGIAAFPYVDWFTAAWSRRAATPCVALKYDDGTYPHIATPTYPVSAYTTVSSFATDTDPDEIGMIFQFPGPVKVGGAWVRLLLAGDAEMILYDSDGSTALATVTLDANVRPSVTGAAVNFMVRFPTDVSLTAATDYRLAIKPTSVTDPTIYTFTVNAAALMDAFEGGQAFHYTQRVDAGSWAETTTRRPWMGLLVTAIDDGAAGGGASGGLKVHPGMTGGMRG